MSAFHSNSVLSLLAWLILLYHISTSNSKRFPIVYVYTVGPYSCKHGLPKYIEVSLEQAVMSQPDCDIIMASNYKECSTVEAVVDRIPNVIKFDTTAFSSNRTKEFANASEVMFAANFNGELWATSAVRFFGLEDLMRFQNYTELMHIEADNLLYGKITSLLPSLRANYTGLAATPLNSNKSFITASVLWIPTLAALVKFNDFLLALGKNLNKEWQGYLDWLRPYGCCKKGGVDPDKDGNGIKPFAINEMSMLAYYHHLRPKDFFLFPVVPTHPYVLNKYIANLYAFAPMGSEVPGPTGGGVWDPNSWGQYLGGTSLRRGKDKGFTDPSHIAGQALRTNGCRPKMMCSNITMPFAEGAVKRSNATTATALGSPSAVSAPAVGVPAVVGNGMNVSANHSSTVVHPFALIGVGYTRATTNQTLAELSPSSAADGSGGMYCYTAPYVRCDGGTEWALIWNLHVHSKHTHNYKSEKCKCGSG